MTGQAFLAGILSRLLRIWTDWIWKAVVFERAYCAAPLSNPSRVALMTGYRPSTSGIYENESFMRDSELLKDAVTLPKWFSNNGYYSLARGKIFHTPNGPWADPQSWDLHVPIEGSYGNTVSQDGYMVNGIPVGEVDANLAGGPRMLHLKVHRIILTQDGRPTSLQEDHIKPFFLACGIFRPHLTWFVPKEFYDKFDPDTLVLPEVNENDYDDIPSMLFYLRRITSR